jgi:hypothetical protein
MLAEGLATATSTALWEATFPGGPLSFGGPGWCANRRAPI